MSSKRNRNYTSSSSSDEMESYFEKKRKIVDIFDQPDAHRSLALEVEGRKFWVSRETLASFSPVFKAMLYGQFVEAETDVVPLPGKKAKDIEQLLLFLHPSSATDGGRRAEITYDNLEPLLALAEEYQIDMIKVYAEHFMISEIMYKKKPTFDVCCLSILRICSKYRLKNILFELIKRNASKIDAKEFKRLIPELRSEVVAAVLMFKNCTEAMKPTDDELRAMLNRM